MNGATVSAPSVAPFSNTPSNPWKVEDLAAQHDCDPDHFARVFRREIGLPPGRYVIRCRIDRARYLLLHSKQSIGAIAEQLGYHDAFYFSKQFKRNTGMSPSDFRQQIQ